MTKEKLMRLAWMLILPLSLLPWAYTQINIALNTNHAWLLTAASRLLQGDRLTESYFESNPPLSVLLYVPPALLHQVTGIAIYYTPYLLGIVYVLISCWAVRRILSCWPAKKTTRDFAVLIYLLANIFMPGTIHFAERDHVVFLALCPLMLWQVSLTYGLISAKPRTWAWLTAGFLVALIKPHYLLFPAFAFLNRLALKRSLRPILTAQDFKALILSILLYALILLIFFQDYVALVFADFLFFYIGAYNPGVPAIWALYIMLIVPGAVCVFFLDAPRETRKAALALFLGAFIGSLLFLIQMKGFYYHAFASQAFLFMGYGFIFYLFLERLLRSSSLAVTVSGAALIVFFYTVLPPHYNFPTHSEYKNLRLPKLISACAPDCSFFAISENMEMIHQTAIYTGATHASRFTNFWWLPQLMAAEQAKTDMSLYKKKYIGYVAEDLRKWKPEILAIATNLPVAGEENFDIIQYFSQEPDFAAAMNDYRRQEILTDDRGDYFRGAIDESFPITYQIYRRQ